jgi:hypothetical protein
LNLLEPVRQKQALISSFFSFVNNHFYMLYKKLCYHYMV